MISEARKGNHQAFKEIVKKHVARVAATVIGMLGYCQEAEDIGQETFIRFYQSLDRFRGDSSVGTYLTRIAIKLSLNEIRRRQRRRKFFFTNADDKIENIPDPNNPKDRKETKHIIQQGIQKLDPKFRSVLVLRLIDGFSTEETAQILDLPIGTVLSRLARAQMKLREILKPSFGG